MRANLPRCRLPICFGDITRERTVQPVPAFAAARLKRDGPNALDARRRATALGPFANQFRSPLVPILIFAAVVSLIASEWVDAAVVLAIVLGSTILGFAQE